MSSSSAKHDPIIRLNDKKDYPKWKRQLTAVLRKNNVWGHVEGDPNMPMKPDATSTPAEIAAYQTWWRKDSSAQSLILRHISPIIGNTVMTPPQGSTAKVTARRMWTAIASEYFKSDAMEQMSVKNSLRALKLKDHHGFARFIHEFKSKLELLAMMGCTYDEYETCLTLLDALPAREKESWDILHQSLFQLMFTHTKSVQARASNIPPLAALPVNTLFNGIVNRIETECRRLVALFPVVNRPGSKYGGKQ